MRNNKQTAVEWLVAELRKPYEDEWIGEIIKQAKEMEKQQRDALAIEFAEWYENDVLAKADYSMICKDKKELLEIFKDKIETNEK